MMQELFEKALGVEKPWYVKSLQFDPEAKRLDIAIDFEPKSRNRDFQLTHFQEKPVA